MRQHQSINDAHTVLADCIEVILCTWAQMNTTLFYTHVHSGRDEFTIAQKSGRGGGVYDNEIVSVAIQ